MIMETLMICIIISMFSTPINQYDYIEIEHTGISDKPIQTIIISKKSINQDNDINFIINNLSYNDVIKNLNENFKNINTYNGSEYGSFRFSIFENGNKIFERNIDRLNSNKIIDKIIDITSLFESNYKLTCQLNTLKKRIKY